MYEWIELDSRIRLRKSLPRLLIEMWRKDFKNCWMIEIFNLNTNISHQVSRCNGSAVKDRQSHAWDRGSIPSRGVHFLRRNIFVEFLTKNILDGIFVFNSKFPPFPQNQCCKYCSKVYFNYKSHVSCMQHSNTLLQLWFRGEGRT